MWIILLLMLLGIAVGRLLRGSRIIAFADKAVTVVIAVMLLVMGWSVGGNPSVVSGLSGYGITALVLAVAGVAGSVFGAYLFHLYSLKKKTSEKENDSCEKKGGAA
ncbi:MAG: LysO family transporter [Alloprevotella sp.]